VRTYTTLSKNLIQAKSKKTTIRFFPTRFFIFGIFKKSINGGVPFIRVS